MPQLRVTSGIAKMAHLYLPVVFSSSYHDTGSIRSADGDSLHVIGPTVWNNSVSDDSELSRTLFSQNSVTFQILKYLGRDQLAKPKVNRFRIFRFCLIDLTNLKPISRIKPNRFRASLLERTEMVDSEVNVGLLPVTLARHHAGPKTKNKTLYNPQDQDQITDSEDQDKTNTPQANIRANFMGIVGPMQKFILTIYVTMTQYPNSGI